MIKTASLTLLALFGSVAMTLLELGSPLAAAHLAFAVGIVPLIMAAMIHFVPVLTRTGDPGTWLLRLPQLAQFSGLVVVLAMQSMIPYGLLHAAAAADLILAAVLSRWITMRVNTCLGAAHPGWRWYGASLACLMLALLAILLQPLWPDFWRSLRLFHLHLNTLGFVGLAALGTLPVLIPTALTRPDPEAGGWLRRRLWLVAGGALIVASGAAVAWPLAAPGAALMMVAVLGLLGQWSRRFGLRTMLFDGVAVALLSALSGLMLTLIAGVAHGAGLLPARPALLAWGTGFLLPLVTGALSQLLPVWRWPGPQTPERSLMRSRLAAGGRWRALFFLLAGMSMLDQQVVAGGLFAAVAMLRFAYDLLQAVRVTRSTR